MSFALSPLLGILGLGAPELVLILVILLLLFGGAKLPGLAKGLGQSIREFKNAAKEEPKDEKKPDSGNDPSKLRNN